MTYLVLTYYMPDKMLSIGQTYALLAFSTIIFVRCDSLFYKRKVSERLSSFPSVTQLAGGRMALWAKFESNGCALQNYADLEMILGTYQTQDRKSPDNVERLVRPDLQQEVAAKASVRAGRRQRWQAWNGKRTRGRLWGLGCGASGAGKQWAAMNRD